MLPRSNDANARGTFYLKSIDLFYENTIRDAILACASSPYYYQ